MPLISFDQYRESSPATRNKWAAALGLQPPYSADVYGHSTPIKFVADKLKEKINAKPKKGKHKDQPQVDESHDAKPDYSFDRFISKATQMRGEMDDEEKKAKEDEDKLDADIKKAKSKPQDDDKKSPRKFPPEKALGRGNPHEKPKGDDEKDKDFDDDVKEWEQAWADMESDIEARTSNKGW
jgi:hypothetical protein